MTRIFFAVTTYLLLFGCRDASQQGPYQKVTETYKRIPAATLQQRCNEELTQVIVYDIISPPVASRIYAYSNLAFYEALRPAYPASHSLLPFLRGFDTLRVAAPAETNTSMAAALAFLKVAHTLSFSKDSIAAAQKRMEALFLSLPEAVQTSSRNWADSISGLILRRAATDQYKKTRGMPRYSVFGEKGKWQQTPPEYADATEPHWRLIKPLLIDSASAYRPPPPPPYDMRKGSLFYKELMEVYQIRKNLTQEQDTIARFWDDNPFVTEHRGHLTFANKKMTPVGHWMGIIGILCGQANHNELKGVLAHTLCAAAIFDGFISCWEEKYLSLKVRPVTVIREAVESEWEPLLQTPSFPEYTSGHSVISAAAAVTAEHILGKDLAFTDTTEMKYLGLSRTFPSIMAASDEAGISRLYGGIHFNSAIKYGKEQGTGIGKAYCRLYDHINQ
ncbi:MAG: hypothetical protein RL732_91 [Bacteroidota bacterium]